MSGHPPAALAELRRSTGPLDLRLALPAAAAWLTAWLARGAPPGLLAGAAAAAACVAVLVLRRSALVAAVLVCIAAAGLAVAARSEVRTTGPLPRLAATGSAAVLDVVLTDDPHLSTGGRRDVVVAPVRVRQVDAAGESTRVRVAALVLSTDRRWLALLPSQRVRVEGRLRAVERGDRAAALLSARGPPEVLSGPSAVQRVAGRLRAGLRAAVAPLPAGERGLLPGLVVGDVSRLDPALREDFRITGLTHLVAVSGTNVAVVLGAALLLARALGLGLMAGPLLSSLALAGFVVLARPSPSVVRAAVMGVVGLVALVSGSRRSALPSLSGAVLVLVLLDPPLAGAPGFALSVLATAGLIVLAPGWTVVLSRWMPVWVAAALAVPAAAQLACGPVIVAISGTLGALSVPANLLAAPAVAPATVLGVLAALVAPVSLPLAQGLAWLAYLPTAWLVRIAHTGAGLPGAGIGWPSGVGGGLLLAALSVALLAVLARRAPRRALAAAAVGVLLAVVGLRAAAPAWPPPGWLVVACDVGQGDALVLRAGPGQAVVVDAGPDPRAVDHCLRRLGVQSVPMLLLTHLHADHVDGLPGVLRRPVGLIEVGPLDQPPQQAAAVTRRAAAAKVPLERARLGEVRELGPLRWRLLAPERIYQGTSSDPNNESLVLRFEVAGLVVLLTGDVEPTAQTDLLAMGMDLSADVLKVPHHGSNHQLPAFLRAVAPRVTLTSVGAHNTYGHPSARTLDQLRQQGARSYRTDQDGDVAITSASSGLQVVGSTGRGTADGPHVMGWSGTTQQDRAVVAASAEDVAAATTAGAESRGSAVGTDRSRSKPLPRARSPPRRTGVPRPAAGEPRAWDHGQVPSDALVPLTLVVGDEELLVSRAIGAVTRMARELPEDVDVRELEPTQIQSGDLTEILSPSLYAEQRVLVLRAVQDLADPVVAELRAIVADPPEGCALVCVHAGGQKGKSLLTALAASATVTVPAAKLKKPGERRDFVRNELRAGGRPVDEDAVGALLEAVGNDLRELASAVQQLLSDTDGPVTAEVVARYHRGRAEGSGFAVADRAVEGDLAGALELVRWWRMIKLEHVLVTSAMASTLRSMAMVASAGRGPAGAIAGRLGMPPWKVEKTQRQVRGWRPEALVAAMQAVAVADADVKGGAADQDYAVERMLMAVTQARGEGR